MEFRSNASRRTPAQPQNTSSPQSTAPPDHPVSATYPTEPRPRNSGRKKAAAWTLLLIIVSLGVGVALGWLLPHTDGDYSRVDKGANQAVFLANDQVYFGKITEITDDVITMKGIFYLQKGNEQSEAPQNAASTAQQPNLSLAKLGNELHGPQDQMQINRDQVVFWENLKQDGKVSKAIKAYSEQ